MMLRACASIPGSQAASAVAMAQVMVTSEESLTPPMAVTSTGESTPQSPSATGSPILPVTAPDISAGQADQRSLAVSRTPAGAAACGGCTLSVGIAGSTSRGVSTGGATTVAGRLCGTGTVCGRAGNAASASASRERAKLRLKPRCLRRVRPALRRHQQRR